MGHFDNIELTGKDQVYTTPEIVTKKEANLSERLSNLSSKMSAVWNKMCAAFTFQTASKKEDLQTHTIDYEGLPASNSGPTNVKRSKDLDAADAEFNKLGKDMKSTASRRIAKHEGIRNPDLKADAKFNELCRGKKIPDGRSELLKNYKITHS